MKFKYYNDSIRIIPKKRRFIQKFWYSYTEQNFNVKQLINAFQKVFYLEKMIILLIKRNFNWSIFFKTILIFDLYISKYKSRGKILFLTYFIIFLLFQCFHWNKIIIKSYYFKIWLTYFSQTICYKIELLILLSSNF